jgi:acetyl/propionyl-CoA carboxylase alpha subunit
MLVGGLGPIFAAGRSLLPTAKTAERPFLEGLGHRASSILGASSMSDALSANGQKAKQDIESLVALPLGSCNVRGTVRDAFEGQTMLVYTRGFCADMHAQFARELGFKVVCVRSPGDSVTPFAHKVVDLPGKGISGLLNVRDSLARIEKQVGRIDRVMTGWGGVSEDRSAIKLFEDRDIIHVGPSSHMIGLMGDKVSARAAAIAGGLDVVPGTGVLTNPEEALALARNLGFQNVIIKAVAGGGGKGIRVTDPGNADQFIRDFQVCQEEGSRYFSDDRVFIEGFVSKPKHLELQMFSDWHGNVLCLGGRECSAQRRNQKVIEETKFDLPLALKGVGFLENVNKMAMAQGMRPYLGAGTIELLVGSDGRYFFMEMNTRLQVEHPITEMVTGAKLIQMMMAVSDKRFKLEPGAFGWVPPGAKVIKPTGYAAEARLMSETAQRIPGGGVSLIPAPTTFEGVVLPHDPDVRVVYDGAKGVTEGFDPHFASIVVKAPNREEGLKKLDETLERTFCGFDTNIPFLRTVARRILSYPAYHIKSLEQDLERNPGVYLNPKYSSLENAARAMRSLFETTKNGPSFGMPLSAVDPNMGPLPTITEDMLPPAAPVRYGTIWTKAHDAHLSQYPGDDTGARRAGSVATVQAWREAVNSGQTLLTTTQWRDWAQVAVTNLFLPQSYLKEASYVNRLPWMTVESAMGAFMHALLMAGFDPFVVMPNTQDAVPDQITIGLGRGHKTIIAYGDGKVSDALADRTVLTIVRDGKLRSIRGFHAQNDLDEVFGLGKAVVKAGAIFIAGIVYNRKYTSDDYVRMYSELIERFREQGKKDGIDYLSQIIFEVKAADGLIDFKAIEQLYDVPQRVQDRTGIEPTVWKVHTHDNGNVPAIFRELQARGEKASLKTVWNGLDVVPEGLFRKSTQPSADQVVQILEDTPHPTRFPIQHMDGILPFHLQVANQLRPYMPDNLVTNYKARATKLPPGAYSHSLKQYSKVAPPGYESKFLDIYPVVNEKVFNGITGVTPSSKDMAELSLAILVANLPRYQEGKPLTWEEMVSWVIQNPSSIPQSPMRTLLGMKGKPQFGGYNPEVVKAIQTLPEGAKPAAKEDTRKWEEIKSGLEAEYGTATDGDVVLHLFFPEDFKKLKNKQNRDGLWSMDFEWHHLVRGVKAGETVSLHGHTIGIDYIGETSKEGKFDAICTLDGHKMHFRNLVDTKKSAEIKSRTSTSVQLFSGDKVPDSLGVTAMPGKWDVAKQNGVALKSGDKVEAGQTIGSVEAMKMQTMIKASKSGTLKLTTSFGSTVERAQILFEIS